MASIEDFKKLEFKVAQIKEVTDHPNADRLYVLKVSLGVGPEGQSIDRQLVAGIRSSYPDKEKLIGRRVVIVANLDPAVIRGVESQGMVLAASDELGAAVLSPERDVALGSIVK
ncbi:MAG: methionine--tRNA ligase subunit beta [Candidatus Omnitrophica bacterium]|nr:methionine--tRNA ligase subunit beta [Candidatus Omnitrophota bacterium]